VNILIWGKPFYVIIYESYKLQRWYSFGPLCTLFCEVTAVNFLLLYTCVDNSK